MSYRLLLVDDDTLFLCAFKALLVSEGYTIDTAETGEEAVKNVKCFGDQYAVVLLDFHLEGLRGEEVIEKNRAIQTNIFILIHSGDPSRDVLKKTWQAGATGFLEKGGDLSAHLDTIRNWCQKYEETQRTLHPFEVAAGDDDMIPELKMIGRSRCLREIAARTLRYRNSNQNVLILGETGTGKELLARALHANKQSQFFAINCAAYKGTTDLLESEFFGHEKGAFTGATNEKRGIFESANGGTVFLDEVHHLNLVAQAKLLRACQDKNIRRVGGTKEIPVNFRLIASSKPDIELRCERGEFLHDLFHRLNTLLLLIPPLRDRSEDIEPLVAHFCRKFTETSGLKKTFLMRTVRQLHGYSWPGNVRELENMIYRLLTDCPSNVVGPEQLDAKFFNEKPNDQLGSYESLKEKHFVEERAYLKQVLSDSSTKSDAAEKMKISPSTLHSMIKRLGLYQGMEGH